MRILSAAVLLVGSSAFNPIAFAPRTFSSTALKMATQDELKKLVGYKAVDDYVKSGMVIGLGTGSTAYFAVERVGQLLKSGELTDILAIPTSIRTKEQAESLNIPLVTLDTHSKLDVAIDGADEVDPGLNLVKGGGGALLREKMVEICSDKFIVIGTSATYIRVLCLCVPVVVVTSDDNQHQPILILVYSCSFVCVVVYLQWTSPRLLMALALVSLSPLKLLPSVTSTR